MTKDEAKEKIINDFCKCRVWCELYPDLCRKESCEIWWALKALTDRPTGEWIEHTWAEEYDGLLISNYECTNCHSWERDNTDFCPNCGADNRGEKKR